MSRKFCPAVQAYKSTSFLASAEARNIRILCEHEDTKARLERHNITASVLIFGSARAKSYAEYDLLMSHLLEELDAANTSGNDEAYDKGFIFTFESIL